MGRASKIALVSLAGSYGLVHLGLVSQYASTVLRQYVIAFFVLFLGIYLPVFLYRNQIYPKLLSPLRHLPGPTKGNNFLNGQAKRIFGEESGEPHREWINTIPNDGLLRYLGVWNQERLIPTSKETLAEALTSKSYIYIKPTQLLFNIERLLGNGLLIAEGDEHKRQRKILVPAFHHRHLITISHHFWEKSQLIAKVFTSKIAETENGTVVLDIDDWSSRVTLDIIGAAGFGLDFEALTNDDSLLLNTYRMIFKPTKGAIFMAIAGAFLPLKLMANLPLKRNFDLYSAGETIKKVALGMINEKRKIVAEKEKEKGVSKDILSVMIEDGQLSDIEMQNQLMTFLAAGHETTSSAVTWCLYALAQDFQLQNRLRDDIRANIASLDDPSVTPEKLDTVRMLRNVCNETLRYHAPVPVTVRNAAEDTTLGGQFVRKGTFVMIAPAAVNRSVSMWGEDADEFKPDRWDKPGGSGGATSNYAMLTFLMGPRSCIGQKFAVDEFKFIIAALVGRFQFEIDDPTRKVKKTGFVTLRPEGGLPMKVNIVPGW